jgi:branched-chain amino acid transport system substrate-binding protein
VLEKTINETGGIQGRPLKYVFHDDRTNTQTALQIAGEIIDSGAQVFMGPSISAMCRAVEPLIAKNGPFNYCFSPGITPTPGTYWYSSNVAIRDALPSALNYLATKGLTRVAAIFSTDTTGQDAERGLDDALKLPQYKNIQLVSKEHFAPADISVSAQVEKMRSADPQVVIAWTSGTPVGTVLRGVSQSALKVPVIIGQANLSEKAMKQFADILPDEVLIPSGYGSSWGEIPGLDPRVAKAREAYFAKMTEAGVFVENAGEVVWDSNNVVIETLRKLGPNAKAADILKHIQGINDYVGISGIYDYTKNPQRGLGTVEVVMARWNAKANRFEVVSGIAGKVEK